MIFNEKALMRLIKRYFKNGLIYGCDDERYLFGGGYWRAAIDINKTPKTITGELLKMTGIIPTPGTYLSIDKDNLVQYAFTDPQEFALWNEDSLIPLKVTPVIYGESERICVDSNLNTYGINQSFLDVLDQDSITDEEEKFRGPFYDEYNEKFIWFNDLCVFKVWDSFKQRERTEGRGAIDSIAGKLPADLHYTFHG